MRGKKDRGSGAQELKDTRFARAQGLKRTLTHFVGSCLLAAIAQLVEHPHGKGKVTGSIPVCGSMGWLFFNDRGRRMDILSGFLYH